MHLKKIELVGFKSFADRTLIYFDKGVTCIVGPNGCGKSNISDAMRWVLGERKAKLLRGSKMEDVIFAGTQLRKPVAFAEVSLTIDNRDRGLAIDYNEVTITRRLHRTGESEYLINKTACRLKDIQDLILDTGIGSNSYSMIEQGRIDYILNASSDERRFLIEEAAGISKYKVKKEEALRKLERTEQNLLRLKDIVAEVQRNIQYAERQAKRAKKYQENFEQLKDLEVRHAFYDLAHLGSEQDEIKRIREEGEKRIDELQQAIRTNRREHEEQSVTGRDVSERHSREEAHRYEIKAKIEQNDQQLRFNQEKRVELATRRGEIQNENAQLQEQVVKTRGDLDSKRREKDSIEGHRLAAQQLFDSAKKSLDQVEDHLDAAKNVFNTSKQAAVEASGEANRVRNEYHRLCAFLETSIDQKRKSEAGVNRYQEEMNQWTARKQDCEKSLEELELKLQTLGGRKGELEGICKDLRGRIAENSEALESLERSLHEKETRRYLLEEIDASSGISQEGILEALTEEERRMIRTLRDVTHVESGYELAAESVLGDFAKALITENEDVGIKLLKQMTEKKSAPAGFLVRKEPYFYSPSETAPLTAEVPFGTPLSHYIKIDGGYEALLLPFFEKINVLDELDADRLPEILEWADRERFVTREGTLLGPHRRVFFRQGNLSSEQSLFRRGAEIESLKEEADGLRAAIDEKKKEAESLNQHLGRSEAEAKEVEHEFLEAKIQRESMDSIKNGMQERLGTYQQELRLIFSEQDEMRSKEEEAIAEKTQLEIELMRIEERHRRIRSEQEQLVHDMERMERAKGESLKNFADHKARLDSLVERNRFLEEAIGLLEANERRDTERLESLSRETEKISDREQRLTSEDAEIRSRQEQLTEEASQSDRRLEQLRAEKQAIESQISALEEKLRQLQASEHEIEQSIHETEKKGMDLGYRQQTIHERIQQSYRIDLAQLDPAEYPLEEAELEETRATIEKLRKKIDTIGTVNLLAIEEYDELKERFEFLMNQQNDLEDAKASLLEAIRKINRTTKGLFESTFDAVQNAFKGYYETLFGGGEAKLVLIDESNPLESGVDIIVRPPGKKLQHISLMSGGEKAMTALALLFALFSIKPSPFCVLDEVDAPLDEANVERFLSVVRPFLKMSQFIIVTHNRKTIGMGDSLYGVTMQEAGVSKIVSVKVNQDVTDEAFEEQEAEPEEEAGEIKNSSEIETAEEAENSVQS